MPNIRNISFNEALHQYTDEESFVYTSVTTKIKSVEQAFDKEYWSLYKANERGVTQEEILKEWEEINKISCDKGTIIHKKLEDSINNVYHKEFPLYRGNESGRLWKKEIKDLDSLANSDLRFISIDIYNYLVILINNGWTLYTEYRVYLQEHLIAGTIDLLAIKGDDFIIVDWKTNKDELHFKSGYYKKKWQGGVKVKTTEWVDKKEYFLKPLGHLEYCKGNIYSLQLSMYAYIMKEWEYKLKGLVLYHIRDIGVKPYKINYLENEARVLIKS